LAADEIDSVDLFMKSIETLLITDPDRDENAAGNARCQSSDIDKREQFVIFDASEYDFQIVFKHDSSKKERLLEVSPKGEQNLHPIPENSPRSSILEG